MADAPVNQSNEAPARCVACGEAGADSELVPIPPHLLHLAKGEGWKPGDMICRGCLNQKRRELILKMMGGQEEVKELEERVLQSILDNQPVSHSPEDDDEVTNWSDKLSDTIAKFGGSWRFILSFMSVMLIWIAFNSLAMLWKPFDPYPFILLNLALSCLAALQAPIIMMSQNRQEERDRKRNINDYQVNLKAELEIRQLHLKMDQLLYHQWQQLFALQELQVDMLEDLLEQATGTKAPELMDPPTKAPGDKNPPPESGT